MRGLRVLIIALFLFCRSFVRWRRWGDVRTHLLGNKPELAGFLRRWENEAFLCSSHFCLGLVIELSCQL